MRPRLHTVLAMALLAAPFQCLAASGAGLTMKVTESGYLDAPGVSVMLYDDNYSPIFFDQKNAAMHITLRQPCDGSAATINSGRGGQELQRDHPIWSKHGGHLRN